MLFRLFAARLFRLFARLLILQFANGTQGYRAGNRTLHKENIKVSLKMKESKEFLSLGHYAALMACEVFLSKLIIRVPCA